MEGSTFILLVVAGIEDEVEEEGDDGEKNGGSLLVAGGPSLEDRQLSFFSVLKICCISRSSISYSTNTNRETQKRAAMVEEVTAGTGI